MKEKIFLSNTQTTNKKGLITHNNELSKGIN